MDNNGIVVSPKYSVNVGGKKFNETARGAVIDSIKISSPIDGSKTLDVEITDPDFEIIGADIYVKDSPISANISLNGASLSESFEGFISAIDVNFPSEGLPKISIMGIDNAHLLSTKRKSRTWSNTTKVAVMEQIAKEHGLSFNHRDVPLTVHESIVQDDQTDLEFIEDLKKDEGDEYRLSFDGKGMVFEKIDFKADLCGTLSYRIGDCSIMSFQPQINKETKETEVTDKDITSDTKQETQAIASSVPDDNIVQGAPVERNDTPSGKSNSAVASPIVTFNWENQNFKEE